MHILLTDRLTCPRCGPAFGLILRADHMEDRRALEGGLGCPNCREVYPVRGGVGDLRPPPRPPRSPGTLAPPTDEEVGVAQALLGLLEGPGQVALVGSAARFAPALARLIPGAEMVAADHAVVTWDEEPGVSRLVPGPRLPFGDRGFRGVLLEGEGAVEWLREAARILAPGHRVVVLRSPDGTPGVLMGAGLTLKLEQDGVVVAGR